MRALVILFATLALATVLAGAAASSRNASGLRGLVMRGPTRPVCDTSCEAPAKGLVLQFRRDGEVKAQVRTSRTGSYLVRLRPGRYTVTTPKLRPREQLTPELVRVPRGHIGRVDLHLDTGLQ